MKNEEQFPDVITVNETRMACIERAYGHGRPLPSGPRLPQTGEGVHGERLSPLPSLPEDFKPSVELPYRPDLSADVPTYLGPAETAPTQVTPAESLAHCLRFPYGQRSPISEDRR